MASIRQSLPLLAIPVLASAAIPANTFVTGNGAIPGPAGAIASVAVTGGGSGYSIAPAVSFTGGGTGATAHAVLTGDAVTSVVIDTPGSGYVSPTVVFTGANTTPATATAAVAAGDALGIAQYDIASGAEGAVTTLGIETLLLGGTVAQDGLIEVGPAGVGVALATGGKAKARALAAGGNTDLIPVLLLTN